MVLENTQFELCSKIFEHCHWILSFPRFLKDIDYSIRPFSLGYSVFFKECCNIDLASIATLPTEVGDGLEEQDMYSP